MIARICLIVAIVGAMIAVVLIVGLVTPVIHVRKASNNMGNMGYCRFQNTTSDMDDCIEHIDDHDLSEEEQEARKDFIEKCVDVALDYGYEIDRPVVEE